MSRSEESFQNTTNTFSGGLIAEKVYVHEFDCIQDDNIKSFYTTNHSNVSLNQVIYSLNTLSLVICLLSKDVAMHTCIIVKDSLASFVIKIIIKHAESIYLNAYIYQMWVAYAFKKQKHFNEYKNHQQTDNKSIFLL